MWKTSLGACPIIAIDPGQAGGIVRWWTPTGNELTGESIQALSMPKTDRELCDLFAADALKSDKIAYLEDLVKYTGKNMPSSSMAVYASNWGFIKGALTAFRYRIVLVPPKKWQAALGLGSKTGLTTTVWKNKLKQRAEQLYPNIKVTLATADALLIAEAAKQGKLG